MKRILIIEDAPDIRGIIAETIHSKGWQAILAEDGEQGITLAGKEHPDLILCDIRMPKMDGYAVLEQLRKSPDTAMVPFIFLSGLAERPQIRQGMDLGADDYLLKPFTPIELIAAIEARLHKQNVISKSAEKKLNDLRESLSAALPHELGTPLNTILGFSSLIAESSELSAKEIREFATYIHSSGQRLRELIEKFLLFSQIELIAADPEQLKVLAEKAAAPVKETVISSAQKAARKRERSDDLKVEAEEVEHRVGAAHLERMIDELIENACHFSPPNSPIELRSRRSDSNFCLTVVNYGKGLSSDQIAKLTANLQFDRHLHEQQGVGLGLAITRKLAELYGGWIEISSTPEVQTKVTIHLPL